MKAKDWKKLAKCAGIRAIKTVAQTAIATIGTVTVLGQIDTKLVISTSMLAGILSLLTSICLLYTSPSPRDGLLSRMPSSA